MSSKRSRKNNRFFTVGLIFLLVIGMVGVVAGIYTLSRPASTDTQNTLFIIRKGDTVDEIGQNLKSEKLIRSPAMFKFTVMRLGIATQIQAGSFYLQPSLTPTEIARSLTSGRQDIWITILEGWRREEIAQALEENFTAVGTPFDAQTFLNLTQTAEGLLFPDTYLFPLDATEAGVASVLTNTFEQKITDKMRADIQSQGRTMNQIITMASLIEREARGETARKTVSGILWKRLENDWPLQVDATLQYAIGYDKIEKTWWKPPFAADKNINSPYNTYQNPGLPPGPICSPSLSSIQAAIYPTSSSYWFYITDNDGRMHYAVDNDQHNQNVQTYLR